MTAPSSPSPAANEPNATLARRIAVLDAVAIAVSESADMDALLDRVLHAVLDVTGVDGGGIFLLDGATGGLRLAAHQGASARLVESFAVDPSPTLAAMIRDPRAPVLVRTIPTDAHRQIIRDEGIRAYMGISLHVRDQVLGVLVAMSKSSTEFLAGDVELMVSVGRQIGVAIERMRLFDRERRRAHHLATINEVGRRLAAIRSEQELLPRTVHYVRQRLGYDSANLLLLDALGERLVHVAGSGLGNERLMGGSLPLDDGGSLAGWVIVHEQPLIVNDVAADPRYFRAGEGRERAEMVVPILAGTRVLGVLNVQSERTGAFDEVDSSVLQTLARQIGDALEAARLYDAMERSLRRTRALQEVSAAVSGSLDLEATLEHALDAAMRVFEADRAAIYLIDADGRRIRRAASRGLSDAYINAVHSYYDSHPNSSLSQRLATLGSIYIPDARAAPLVPGLTEPTHAEGFRSSLFLSLRQGEELLGTFVLYHDSVRAYDSEETELAHALAAHATIAIQHARLYAAERRARDHASTILEATRTVAGSLRLEDVLREAAGCIAAALGERRCAVWVLDEDGDTMTPTFRDLDGPVGVPSLDGIPMPIDALPRARAVIEGRVPLVVDDPTPLGPIERAIQEVKPYHGHIALPLITGDRVVGVASVVLAEGAVVHPDDVEVAMAVGHSVALAVENARLYARTRQLAVSEERNRLARDLHDSVTQSLFSITLISRALPRIMERDAAQARERLDRLSELARNALAEMRALIFELRPAALEDEGLASALTKHAAAFEAREGVTVDLQIAGERRISPAAEQAIFRVAQESLNNIAKHAQARHVTVQLVITEEDASLEVIDDGRGFNLADAPSGSAPSLGVTSMSERAALLGGSLEIDSSPGVGTRVRLDLPLAPG